MGAAEEEAAEAETVSAAEARQVSNTDPVPYPHNMIPNATNMIPRRGIMLDVLESCLDFLNLYPSSWF